MSSSPESSNHTVRPEYLIRAKSGTITQTIGDFVSSPFRRRQSSSSSSTQSHTLSKPISKITLKDIKGATRCGGGGFGAVWVLDLPKKGKVALKQLRVSGGQGDDDLLRRTLREGDTWQDLDHIYVLPFLGILETPTDLYLISPYVKNGSLDAYLRNHPNADRGKFLGQTAGGIAYLHECGIVHGDIKPSNILVSDTLDALLCDFGLARSETNATSVSLQGSGTIRFQSPELLREGGGKTFASDAWAFGMAIYEVLSGNIPFHDYPTSRMIDAVANRGELPSRFPSHSPLGASYDLLWNVAQDCWKMNPTMQSAMRDVYERLRQGYAPVVRGAVQWGEALKGHTNDVRSVAFSSDGRAIASGSWDKTVRLWVAKSASLRGGALVGHTQSAASVAFSPDGRTIVSGSWDNTVRLWDVESTSQRGGALEGHTDWVNSVAFSPDGSTIVSGSDDKTLRLWDVESASQRGDALKGHTSRVNSVAFSPDSKTIISGSDDKTLRLWDVESASQRGDALKCHTDYVNSVAFSLDGRTVVSGSSDRTVQLWMLVYE